MQAVRIWQKEAQDGVFFNVEPFLSRFTYDVSIGKNAKSIHYR